MNGEAFADFITATGTAVIAATGVSALIHAHLQLKQSHESE